MTLIRSSVSLGDDYDAPTTLLCDLSCSSTVFISQPMHCIWVGWDTGVLYNLLILALPSTERTSSPCERDVCILIEGSGEAGCLQNLRQRIEVMHASGESIGSNSWHGVHPCMFLGRLSAGIVL